MKSQRGKKKIQQSNSWFLERGGIATFLVSEGKMRISHTLFGLNAPKAADFLELVELP